MYSTGSRRKSRNFLKNKQREKNSDINITLPFINFQNAGKGLFIAPHTLIIITYTAISTRRTESRTETTVDLVVVEVRVTRSPPGLRSPHPSPSSSSTLRFLFSFPEVFPKLQLLFWSPQSPRIQGTSLLTGFTAVDTAKCQDSHHTVHSKFLV